jgi:AhpD family alkylhydroperoxidase
MTAPRIEPGDFKAVGSFAWLVSRASGLVSGTTPPNLFLTLAKRRRLFASWLIFAGQLMPGGRLPRRDTELVILRVAHLSRCRYEREHHERLARPARVTTDEITRTAIDDLGEVWPARDRALLAAVDELHATADLSDASYAALREHLDEPETIEFLMLVGHYQMLATTITTLRIQPDPTVVRRFRWAGIGTRSANPS